jgi:hypothetical protein
VPSVPFASLPDDARLWVFAAAEPVAGDAERALLDAADQFLAGWAAHGVPLRCARDWRDGRFLAIGVDQSVEGASGCSIDGLFRSLRTLEPRLGTTLLAGGRVYWRDADGRGALGRPGALPRPRPGGRARRRHARVRHHGDDRSGAWRGAFERPLAASWHAQVAGLPAATADAGPRAGGAA